LKRYPVVSAVGHETDVSIADLSPTYARPRLACGGNRVPRHGRHADFVRDAVDACSHRSKPPRSLREVMKRFDRRLSRIAHETPLERNSVDLDHTIERLIAASIPRLPPADSGFLNDRDTLAVSPSRYYRADTHCHCRRRSDRCDANKVNTGDSVSVRLHAVHYHAASKKFEMTNTSPRPLTWKYHGEGRNVPFSAVFSREEGPMPLS